MLLVCCTLLGDVTSVYTLLGDVTGVLYSTW